MAEATKAKIYEFAVIHYPPKRSGKDENGEKPKPTVIVDVQRILATSDQEVAMQAARAIPPAFADKLDEVEIAIRPF